MEQRRGLHAGGVVRRQRDLGGGNQNACAFAVSDVVMLKSQKLMGGKRFIC